MFTGWKQYPAGRQPRQRGRGGRKRTWPVSSHLMKCINFLQFKEMKIQGGQLQSCWYPGMLSCAENLLSFSLWFPQATETLKDYPCSAEDIDHEDITAYQTSTLQACLPLELAKVRRALSRRNHATQLRIVHQM